MHLHGRSNKVAYGERIGHSFHKTLKFNVPKDKMKRYYTIDMDAIKYSGLSIMEWMILENIHFLSAEEGWCYATKKSLCDHHDISRQMYYKYTSKLIDEGWLKQNKKSHLKTTKKYLDLMKQKFQSDGKQKFTSHENECKQKFTSDVNKSLHGKSTKVYTPSIKRELKRENEEREPYNPLKEKFTLPDQINKELWNEFEEHRKQIKKPLTDLARKKLVKIIMLNLDQQDDMINRSIENGWAGLFPQKIKHTYKEKEPQVGSFGWELKQKMKEREETIEGEIL